jgi:hypothetical protein
MIKRFKFFATLLFSHPFIFQFRMKYEIMKWKIILKKFEVPPSATSGKSILIASNIGGNLNTLAFDLVVGLALKSRGHSVTFTLCNGAISACMNCELNKFESVEHFLKLGASKLCKSCYSQGTTLLKIADFRTKVIHQRENVVSRDWDYEVAGSGAKRFLAIGRIRDEIEFEKVFNKFLKSSQRMNFEFSEIFDEQRFDLVFAHHGIYVPQGNLVHVAKSKNIPILTWVQGYRKNTFLFGYGDTYHKALLSEEVKLSLLTSKDAAITKSYLDSRDKGNDDWIRFGLYTKAGSQFKIGPNSRKKVLLMTNVSWDAQLHYQSRIFSTMHDWIIQTIYWFAGHPELDLFIRIHPAEVTGRIISRDPVEVLIKDTFPILPKNIQIIGPRDKVSTYALMDVADLGLIFATKAGIELAAKGVPIIVAGESWIRDHGFTNDPKTSSDYFQMLEIFASGQEGLVLDQEKALSFAHHFFFERSIEVKSVKSLRRYPYIRPKLKSVWESKDPGLVKVIERIEKIREIQCE